MPAIVLLATLVANGCGESTDSSATNATADTAAADGRATDAGGDQPQPDPSQVGLPATNDAPDTADNDAGAPAQLRLDQDIITLPPLRLTFSSDDPSRAVLQTDPQVTTPPALYLTLPLQLDPTPTGVWSSAVAVFAKPTAETGETPDGLYPAGPDSQLRPVGGKLELTRQGTIISLEFDLQLQAPAAPGTPATALSKLTGTASATVTVE